MRGKWVGVAVMCGFASSVGAQPGNPPSPPPRREMVPERRWTPTPGAEATAYAVPVPAAARVADLHAYLKARNVGDEVGMRRMVDAKSITLIPDRVGVLILDRRDFTPREAPRIISGDRAAREAILAGPAPEYPPNVLEVRFGSGPLKDESRFVPEDAVAHLVPYVNPTPPPRGAPKPPTPRERAATRLRMGRALERSGKVEAAKGHYRKVIEDVPDSPEAAEAATRLGVTRPE